MKRITLIAMIMGVILLMSGIADLSVGVFSINKLAWGLGLVVACPWVIRALLIHR